MPAAVRGRASVAIAGLVLGSAAIAVSPSATAAPSTTILISEVYGGGGNSGAPFTNDFVELHNISTAAVDLKDWTLKYYSSSTGNTVQGEEEIPEVKTYPFSVFQRAVLKKQ